MSLPDAEFTAGPDLRTAGPDPECGHESRYNHVENQHVCPRHERLHGGYDLRRVIQNAWQHRRVGTEDGKRAQDDLAREGAFGFRNEGHHFLLVEFSQVQTIGRTTAVKKGSSSAY